MKAARCRNQSTHNCRWNTLPWQVTHKRGWILSDRAANDSTVITYTGNEKARLAEVAGYLETVVYFIWVLCGTCRSKPDNLAVLYVRQSSYIYFAKD